MNYIIGTGFFGKNTELNFMATHWRSCVFNHYPESEIIVIANGGSYSPMLYGLDNQCLRIKGNNGHVGSLLNGSKPGPLCGWSSTVLTLAMLAYMEEKDLVFLEQDVIFKGDIIGRMYEECGEKKMIFGPPMKSAPWMSSSQSVFLIKHEFLLTFVHDYIFYGSDKDTLPESKFARLMQEHPDRVTTGTGFVDRERPIPWDDEVWSAQKLSPEEIEEAKRRGIL